MKLHRYVDHQRLHIVTKDVISLSISVLLLFRHYISHKITFGAPSSGGVLRSACGAFIRLKASKERVHRLYIPTSNIVGKVQHFAGFLTLRNVGLLEPTRNRAGKVNYKSGWGN